jgi:hypothetical protein
MVSKIVKKFPAFYGTHRFMVSNRACILVLTLARWIWPTCSHPVALVSILILSSHQCLGIPSGFFPSCFFITTPYALLLSPLYATCTTSFRHTYTENNIMIVLTGYLPVRALKQRRWWNRLQILYETNNVNRYYDRRNVKS